MSIEHKRIDIGTWNGPMTVVGYPDLSAEKYMHQDLPKQASANPELNSTPKHHKKHPKHHA